jgi:hypothetical protein
MTHPTTFSLNGVFIMWVTLSDKLVFRNLLILVINLLDKMFLETFSKIKAPLIPTTK